MCRDFDWQTELKLLADDVVVVTNENINKFAESELPNKFFCNSLRMSEKNRFVKKNIGKLLPRF